MFETISNTVAALLTLSIFSFLYKDNPFYRFAEALLVGVSMGYASWEVTKDETTVKPSGVYVGGSLGFYYQLPVSFPLNMKVAMHAQYALTKKTDEFSNYGIGKLSIGLLTPISG